MKIETKKKRKTRVEYLYQTKWTQKNFNPQSSYSLSLISLFPHSRNSIYVLNFSPQFSYIHLLSQFQITNSLHTSFRKQLSSPSSPIQAANLPDVILSIDFFFLLLQGSFLLSKANSSSFALKHINFNFLQISLLRLSFLPSILPVSLYANHCIQQICCTIVCL